MSYRCTCSKRVGVAMVRQGTILLFTRHCLFGCRGYDGLQPARVPTCPLTCRKRDLGAGRVGPAVPLAVWHYDCLRTFPSSSRKDQDQDCPPQWRLKWAATIERQTHLTSSSPAQPSPFFRFNQNLSSKSRVCKPLSFRPQGC